MKLLKLKVPRGYKMLCKNFEINFLTKTRVNKSANNDDLIELENDFYYPKETAFIGKNSSGKSTTLELIHICLYLLQFGRIPAAFFDEDDSFSLEVIFFEKGKIYKYCGDYICNKLIAGEYLAIVSEDLNRGDYNSNTRKDLSNINFTRVKDFIEKASPDTSCIHKYVNDGLTHLFVNYFEDNVDMFVPFYSIIDENYGKGSFMKLVYLFDDSIEKLAPNFDKKGKNDGFIFKRVNWKEKIVSDGYLKNNLSSGTIRGINLYGAAIVSFVHGSHLLVDELEKNFNKNLIGNLIQMINDPTLNKNNATLIYTTHYSELLDETKRCDNVNVLHREQDIITLKNMCLDYTQRTDMLKSSSFDQNAFDTTLNYNRLMDLKRMLRRL